METLKNQGVSMILDAVVPRHEYVAQAECEVRTQEGHGSFVAREARPAVNRALTQWKDLTAPRPVARTGIPATGV